MSRQASFLKCASFAVVAAMTVGTASAADLVVKAKPVLAPAPSMWDIAFGATISNDYNFRGISQSDRGMSGGGYFEPRFKVTPNFELYVGIAGFSTKLPTTPTGEFDFYGGARWTVGQFTLDIGGIYYYYPRERQMWTDLATIVTPANACGVQPVGGTVPLTVCNTDFAEVYGKLTWASDPLTIGGYVYYSDNFLGSGAYGLYAGGTVKLTAPGTWLPNDIGAYVSAEVAHYWLGTTGATLGNVNLPDYTYWNAGGGFTYKAFTLDLRYHDTDLTPTQCFAVTGDPRGATNGGTSRWCSSAFIAKLSVDTTLSAFK